MTDDARLRELAAKWQKRIEELPNWNDSCRATQHCIDDLEAALAQSEGRAREERADEEKVGDLHRELNRRTAEALGKPFAGENSSWHDIPEQVAALRQQLARVTQERDAALKKSERND